MRKQKGSLLITVAAFATILTAAAASLVLYSANTGITQDAGAKETALHYAAESGMQIGVRWMRVHWPGYFDKGWTDDFVISNGWENFEGYKVQVTLFHTPGWRTLQSIATRGAGYDSLKVTWQIDDIVDDNSGRPTHCILTFSNWKETYRPGTKGP